MLHINKETICSRSSDCLHLTPQPSAVQYWMVRLFMLGLNMLLKAARNPEHVFDVIINLNRLLCGMQLRHQRVGPKVWPYLEGGQGEPVVLLHGFGADKDRFGAMVLFLRRTHHVVIPDLPGFGESTPDWSAAYGIEDQVRRLENFLRAIGLGRVHLLGISLGGYAAAYYASQYPDRVKSLCLMDSAGFSAPVVSDAWAFFLNCNRNIFLCTSAHELQIQMDYLLHRPIKMPSAVKHHWARRGLALFAWRQKLFDDLLAGGIELMDDRACHIMAPTLVIWGAEDRICHVSTVDRIMGMIPHCRSIVIHGCGHIPIVEFPVLSRKLYMAFLRQYANRA